MDILALPRPRPSGIATIGRGNDMPLTTTDFALDLLDDCLGKPGPAADQAKKDHRQLTALGFLLPENGHTVETQSCTTCGATACHTVDADENGNPTSVSQFVCFNGHVELTA